MTLYKVIKNNKSCNGGDFDWTKFLPRKTRPGKWTPRIREVLECKNGYHVTAYWNMWFEEGCEVYEVETKGLRVREVVGVLDKQVCESIRLLKKIDPIFTGNRNTGYWNTGDRNTGNRNTGDWNTGDRNTGDRNTGYWNTGDRNTGNRNTGDRNTGYWNTGDCNTGDRNTGNRNTGNWNTGDWNTGDRNTGYWNTGDRNTGDRNTGYWNTGDWNTGNRNTGAFNTKSPDVYELFNKPIKAVDYEKIEWPSWFYFELTGDYNGDWKVSFENASTKEIQKAVDLPNFSYSTFYEITGISKDMITKKLGE